MPPYFFHVHDGRDLADHDGTELPGPRDARNQAVIACGEMLKDLDGQFWNTGEWTMRVTDVTGVTICTLRFSGTA